MRFILLIIACYITTASIGQSFEKEKHIIDSIVKSIDNDKRSDRSTFVTQARKKVLHYLTYSYATKNKTLIKIHRQFRYKNDSIFQAFYIHKNQLIFATEKIVSYTDPSNMSDHITWGGRYYFSKGKLIDYVTLGHGKSEEEWWHPESEVLHFYTDSRTDVLIHLKKKTGD